MREIRWFLIKTIFTAMLIAGFVYDIKGAQNVVIAYVWVLFILHAFLLCDEDKAIEILRKKGRPIPKYITFYYSVTAIAFLIWHSAIVTGIVYFITVLICEYLFMQAEEGQWRA